jgi:hypothetical protein
MSIEKSLVEKISEILYDWYPFNLGDSPKDEYDTETAVTETLLRETNDVSWIYFTL